MLPIFCYHSMYVSADQHRIVLSSEVSVSLHSSSIPMLIANTLFVVTNTNSLSLQSQIARQLFFSCAVVFPHRLQWVPGREVRSDILNPFGKSVSREKQRERPVQPNVSAQSGSGGIRYSARRCFSSPALCPGSTQSDATKLFFCYYG